MARVLKLLVAVTAAALALAAPAATLAHTAITADSDEPSVPDRFDIESVAVEHPLSVSGRLVRHTIKSRAPYGVAATPRLDLRAPSEVPGKYRFYRIRGTMMLGPDGERTAVWRSETPGARHWLDRAPDHPVDARRRPTASHSSDEERVR